MKISILVEYIIEQVRAAIPNHTLFCGMRKAKTTRGESKENTFSGYSQNSSGSVLNEL